MAGVAIVAVGLRVYNEFRPLGRDEALRHAKRLVQDESHGSPIENYRCEIEWSYPFWHHRSFTYEQSRKMGRWVVGLYRRDDTLPAFEVEMTNRWNAKLERIRPMRAEDFPR
jgi:hypothetical protein